MMGKEDNIILIGGTTEGRRLVSAFRRSASGDARLTVLVATEYGKEILDEEDMADKNIEIIWGRKDESQLVDIIQDRNGRILIDATHPYAEVVSANGEKACERTGASYYRLLREGEEVPENCIFFKTPSEAAEYLDKREGNVLLTTGSKDLSTYTSVQGFENRIYPRILPSPENMEDVLRLGYKKSNLICMQGPFGYWMNRGLLKQVNAKYMVTKESGKIGGFREKIQAALDEDVTVIVIERPNERKSYSIGAIMSMLGLQEGVHNNSESKGIFFPFFQDISEKKILIVGGGNVGMRRLKTLLKFNTDIVMVAEEIPLDMDLTHINGRQLGLKIHERAFVDEDLDGKDLVIAATDDGELNDKIVEKCKALGIPVNHAGNRDGCDFYFPAVLRSGDFTIGISSDGISPGRTRALKKKLEGVLREYGGGDMR